MTAAIEARNVSFSFGSTPALRAASVAVAAGEVLAVMGPSGSGKSTLLHCLAGILVPDGGEVLLADRRIDSLPEAERSALRRDRFGFVFQFGQLVPELTAEENVALPLLLSGARRRDALARARAWFPLLDLAGLEQRRSGELFGGQAQRVALARGMVAEPEVLFADEPTGAPVLTSLPIAGCTLAVSVVAGLNDRRRPFALLRLTGARLRTLRRVVVLESAVPLLVGSSVAVGIGFLTAALFLRSQLGYALQLPGVAYYLVVAAGLLAALGVLASTLPLLRRITAPESARFE